MTDAANSNPSVFRRQDLVKNGNTTGYEKTSVDAQVCSLKKKCFTPESRTESAEELQQNSRIDKKSQQNLQKRDSKELVQNDNDSATGHEKTSSDAQVSKCCATLGSRRPTAELQQDSHPNAEMHPSVQDSYPSAELQQDSHPNAKVPVISERHAQEECASVSATPSQDSRNCPGENAVSVNADFLEFDWEDEGRELFKDVASEMDRWERALEKAESTATRTESTGTASASCVPELLVPLKSHIVGAPFQAYRASQVAAIQLATTPSRSRYVNHVLPATLLPPEASKLGLALNSFYGADKGSLLIRENGKASSDSSDVLALKGRSCRNVGESPPLSIAPARFDRKPTEGKLYSGGDGGASPDTIEETPPARQGGSVVLSERFNSKSGEKSISPSSHSPDGFDGGKFKTPNAAQWLNSKNPLGLFSPSDKIGTSPHSRSSILVTSGGKITPPLCGCGRRAKRKVVCSPGPNEGKPFFVCPKSRGNDRKQGCDYFRWEVRISDNSSSATPLLSDYDE